MAHAVVRDFWPGARQLKHLVVFGASYCDVGYNYRAPHPSAEKPLGVDFPGRTWCAQYDEAANTVTYQPNWVGHLVELFRDLRGDPPLLVYDYALGGDRVEGVERQVHRDFLPHLATKPDWAPWTPGDTLTVTWVGINDCSWNKGTPDPDAACQASITALFALQEELYAAGMRNFCFIDVPPTYNFPAPGPRPRKLRETVLAWNAALNKAVTQFGAEHADATVVVWSSWTLFTNLLADSVPFSFPQEETVKKEGAVFEDGLHPSSSVHLVIAQQILEFLLTLQRPENT